MPKLNTSEAFVTRLCSCVSGLWFGGWLGVGVGEGCLGLFGVG